MKASAAAPPQLFSLPDRIGTLLHITVQHRFCVSIGIVADQVIQLPPVEPGLRELPLHGEGVDGGHRLTLPLHQHHLEALSANILYDLSSRERTLLLFRICSPSDSDPGRLCFKEFIHHLADLVERAHRCGERIKVAGLINLVTVSCQRAFHGEFLAAGVDVVQDR